MTVRGGRRAGYALTLVLVVLFGGCERESFVGSDRRTITTDAAVSAGGAASGGNAGDARPSGCSITECQGHVYRCGNCVDDDGDGKVDMDDPDCLGPCHNAEDTFFGSIPGQKRQGCVSDCYFDQDSGFGNDGCLWSSECDPKAPEGTACAFDPGVKLPRGGDCATLAAAQAPDCATMCLPLTPNGCDCFGCCTIPGASTPVWIGSTDAAGEPSCDLAHVGDPARCRPCTQVKSCLNPCETCERCVGKTELPAECIPDSACVTPVCPRDPCGSACLPSCPAGQACITGCCTPPPR